MKRALLLGLVLVACAVAAYAGEVYGSLSEGGKPVAQGVKVEVICGGNNCAAVLDQFADSSAELALVLFPASYASLKEEEKVPYDEGVENPRVLSEPGR